MHTSAVHMQSAPACACSPGRQLPAARPAAGMLAPFTLLGALKLLWFVSADLGGLPASVTQVPQPVA